MTDMLKASAKSEAVGSLWDSSIRWEVDEDASRNPSPIINWWQILAQKKGSPYGGWPDIPIYQHGDPGMLVVRIYGDGPFSVIADSPEVSGGAKAVPVTGPPWSGYTVTGQPPTIQRITTTESVCAERVEWRGQSSNTTDAKPEGQVSVIYSTTMLGADGSTAKVIELEPGVWVADKAAYGTMLVSYSRRVHLVNVPYYFFPDSWSEAQIAAGLSTMVDGEMVNYVSAASDVNNKSIPLWYKVNYESLNRFPLVLLVRDELRPDNQDIILSNRWRPRASSGGGSSSSGGSSSTPDEVVSGFPDVLTEVSRISHTKTVAFTAPVSSVDVKYIKEAIFEYGSAELYEGTETPVKKQIKFVYDVEE